MGAQHDVVTAEMVPQLDLQTEELRRVAAEMRATAVTARDASSRVLTSWKMLDSSYQAPESPAVLAVMDEAADGAVAYASILDIVSRALVAFADDIDAAKAQLRTIAADVADLGTAVRDVDDWQDSSRLVATNDGIISRIAQLQTAVTEAEALCTAAIRGAAEAPRTDPTTQARDMIADLFGFSSDRHVDRIEELLAGAADPYSTAMYGHLELLRDGMVSGTYDGDTVFEAFQRLTPEQVANLEQYLGSVHAMGHSDLVATFSSQLLAGLETESQVRTMIDSLPSLEPKVSDEVTGWVTADQEKIMKGLENAQYEDVNQGAGQDCWLLAGLGAALVSRPQQIKENITANANGTYTVTLYPDGKATEVTVSGDVPVNQRGRAYYAHPGRAQGQVNWVGIYEKAAAQLIGGGSYDGLTAGHPASGIEITTGRDTETYGPGFRSTGDVTAGQIDEMLKAGRPITCLTQFRGSDATILSWHVYFVTDVNTDGTIVLQNPWGRGDETGVQDELRLSEDQFNQTFELESSGL